MKNKINYRRNLPHIQPKGQSFFITWTLKGAIPKHKKELLKKEYNEIKKIKTKEELDIENRRLLKKYDKILHNEKSGNHYLKNNELSKIVADTIHFWDNKRFELISYCIMSNHVHLILSMYNKNENGKELYLRDVLSSIKKYSARKCNIIIGNTGNDFWQHESYDRIIRNREELHRTILYTVNNPVNAGLCKHWEEWQFSYLKDKYNEF